MLKIYLDTCSIQRPLDTLNQTRMRLEAEAILGILTKVSAQEIALVSSTVLELEMTQNPQAIRREHSEQVLAQATMIVLVNESIEKRSTIFVKAGIKIMDALHLAAAEAAEADYFCTCDDRFLRRAKAIAGVRTVIVSPLELIEAIEL